MESYMLRVILLGLGILFILAIYLWDKRSHVDVRMFKRRSARKESSRHSRHRQRDHSAFDDDSAVDGLPTIELDDETQPEPTISESFSVPVDEPVEAVADDLPSFSARSAFQEFESGAELPTKILQIKVICKDTRISGQMIMDLASELDLKHGQFDIFHRLDQKTGKSVFSVANAVEPGNFDLENITQLSTPGLVLFSQLPAPVDSMSVFNDMLDFAQRIAFIVGAELQDASRCVLTQQSIEHEREQIRLYEAKLNRAMHDLNG